MTFATDSLAETMRALNVLLSCRITHGPNMHKEPNVDWTWIEGIVERVEKGLKMNQPTQITPEDVQNYINQLTPEQLWRLLDTDFPLDGILAQIRHDREAGDDGQAW